MNNKHLWIAAVSGAALTTLVSNLPFIDLVNILCFAGFWGCAILAVWVYRHFNGNLTTWDGVRIGALTGLFAGMLGFAFSFLGMAGLQGLVNGMRLFLSPEDLQSIQDYSMVDALVFNTIGVLFNIFFGTIGGLIGGVIFRTDRMTQKLGEQI